MSEILVSVYDFVTTLFQTSVPGPPGEPEPDLNTAGAVEPALVRSFGPRHSKLLESSAGGFPLVSLVVPCPDCLAFCLEPYLSVPFVFAAGHLCQLACCPPSAASGFGIV